MICPFSPGAEAIAKSQRARHPRPKKNALVTVPVAF
jgi:hypothetical protein